MRNWVQDEEEADAACLGLLRLWHSSMMANFASWTNQTYRVRILSIPEVNNSIIGGGGYGVDGPELDALPSTGK